MSPNNNNPLFLFTLLILFALSVCSHAASVASIAAVAAAGPKSRQIKMAEELIPVGGEIERLLRRYQSLQRLQAAIKINSILPDDAKHGTRQDESSQIHLLGGDNSSWLDDDYVADDEEAAAAHNESNESESESDDQSQLTNDNPIDKVNLLKLRQKSQKLTPQFFPDDSDDSSLLPPTSAALIHQIVDDLIRGLDDADSAAFVHTSEEDVEKRVDELVSEGVLLINRIKHTFNLPVSPERPSLTLLARATNLIHLIDDEIDELETLLHHLARYQKKAKKVKAFETQRDIQAAHRQIDRLLQQLKVLVEE